jgi:preprotein translocase subunit SecF
MIWGVFVGTYSTIFISAPVLLHFNIRGADKGTEKGKEKSKEKEEAAGA